MSQSIARIETERASGYLQQLCKHFAHKLDVKFTPDEGQIPFSAGICRLEASGGTLTMKVEAEDQARLAQVQDVVERHLLRFAFRQPPTIEWRAANDAGSPRDSVAPHNVSEINPSGPIRDSKIRAVIERLHANRRFPERGGPRSLAQRDPEAFADYGFSIHPEQGDLIYLLCRGMGAKRVVDFATSVGMSMLYFAAAMRDNGGGLVIGSELVPAKVDTALGNLRDAGLSDYADIRLGDARKTLSHLGGEIDFALIDGWPAPEGVSLAREVIEILAPQLRVGGYVLNDNAEPDYLEFIRHPDHGFISMTLPLKGGTELSLKVR